jgi:ornithine cyclodeaminase
LIHISDELIDRHVSAADAEIAMEAAFSSFSAGDAAMQERIRTEAGGVKVSTMGAVIPAQGYAGAKVYTTIKGQFRFVILLFSTEDGRPLASFDAGTITRLRTAACSVLAARRMARPDASVLALFGAGVQGVQHAQQLALAFPLRRILVCDPYAPEGLAQQLSEACKVETVMAGPEQLAREADIMVTASRSTEPLFEGRWLKPGAFIAAVGSSLPHTRELDDTALSRAAALVVEWRVQTMREAGDIVRAGAGVLDAVPIYELGDVLTGKAVARRHADDIVIYKAVGVGLQDVALAGLAYQRIMAAGALV